MGKRLSDTVRRRGALRGTGMGKNGENTLKYKFLLMIDEDERNLVFLLKGFTYRNSKGKEKIYRKVAAVYIIYVTQMRRLKPAESLNYNLNSTKKNAADTQIVSVLFCLLVTPSQAQM